MSKSDLFALLSNTLVDDMPLANATTTSASVLEDRS
jgi:hypothetical protein